jgi:hypothetical protein
MRYRNAEDSAATPVLLGTKKAVMRASKLALTPSVRLLSFG